MKKALTAAFIGLALFTPALASASATITSVTLNGGSSVQVNPGATITVVVTATLTDSTKWKGTKWGIGSGNLTTACANTKNAKEGTRHNATGVFSETFTIKAPATPGLYNANFLADEANNCGKPLGSVFQKIQSIQVGTNTVPPADTTAPVIGAHADVFATTSGASAEVSYTLPAATDNVDGAVAVICSPVSGSTFALGTTTVNCSAQDAAGNTAHSSFAVVVTQEVPPPPPEPQEYVMASQPDDSFFCEFTWRSCYTPDIDTGVATIDLGQGSAMGGGTLKSVTIAKDENDILTITNPWRITLSCFADSAYSTPCSDWVAPTAGNGNQTDSISEFASQPDVTGRYWTADFTNAANNKNFDGSSPVVFNPSYYYRLLVDDEGAEVGAYGTETELYWVIKGMR
jgi:HYR domain-containing protein